jgi:hypothetical protein
MMDSYNSHGRMAITGLPCRVTLYMKRPLTRSKKERTPFFHTLASLAEALANRCYKSITIAKNLSFSTHFSLTCGIILCDRK